MRRANTGFMDGWYVMPGGHCDAGETVADAASRECLEEARVRVASVEPRIVMPFSAGVDFIFEATAWDGAASIGEPDKCDDLVWADLGDLPEETAPFVVRALELRDQGVWFHEFH